MIPEFLPLDEHDNLLVEAARDVLRRNQRPGRHGVGAAVRAGSGRIYVGVNIESCCYGPCAEPIALGSAFSNGERDITVMVAVSRRGDEYAVLSPCGNCRQMLLDYAPQATVIVDNGGSIVKTSIVDLLPAAYRSGFDD